MRFGLDFFKMGVPAGGSHHDAAAQRQHGAHVLYRGLGGGEVDDRVHAGQGGGGEGGGVFIFCNVERADVVAAFTGHLGDEASGFSPA